MRGKGEVIYTLSNGLTGTRKELESLFDKYSLDEFNIFYHELIEQGHREEFRPYFKQRMFGFLNITDEEE